MPAGNFINLHFRNQSKSALTAKKINTLGTDIFTGDIKVQSSFVRNDTANFPWLISKAGRPIASYFPKPNTPVGQNVYVTTDSSNITSLKSAILCYQPMEIKSKFTIKAGDIKTFNKGTTIRALSDFSLKFFDKSSITETNSSGNVVNIYDSGATMSVTSQASLTLCDPAKVSVEFTEDADVEITKGSTHVTKQVDKTDGVNLLVSCNSICKNCDGATDTDCTECNTNYYLVGGTCKCPSIGFYENWNYIQDEVELTGWRTEISCSKCHESCVTCHGPTNSDCNECKANYYVLQYLDLKTNKPALIC